MVDLSDAKSLLGRAEEQYTSFDRTTGKLWTVQSGRSDDTGDWSYSLEVFRGVIDEMRFTLVECANSVSSSLDLIAAAIARANGHDRLRNLYFPWGNSDDAFEKKLAKAEGALGLKLSDVIRQARKEHWHEIPHVQAAKEISNDGKHWQLRAAVLSPGGIGAIGQNFKTRNFGVPSTAFLEHDSYEFHRGEELDASRGFQLLLGITVERLDEGLPHGIRSIFPCSFRFVQGVIDAVEQAA